MWFIVALDDEGNPEFQLAVKYALGGSAWVDYGRPDKLVFETESDARAMLDQVMCWDLELAVEKVTPRDAM